MDPKAFRKFISFDQAYSWVFEVIPLGIPEGSLKTARLFPETALEILAEDFWWVRKPNMSSHFLVNILSGAYQGLEIISYHYVKWSPFDRNGRRLQLPSPTKINTKGSFISIKSGSIKVIQPRIIPAARYANCLIVMSPISLN